MSHEVLRRFCAPVRTWFTETFEAPTTAQELGWPAISAGENVLITAPTGSGKTLAAFLWCLNQLFDEPPDGASRQGVHTLYISPLKALNYDVERNLRAPLRGIQRAARRMELPAPEIRAAVRTGDTPQSKRAAMVRNPPHILITTPESLFILLTSPRAREMLTTVRFIIVDEIHALCGNKRGMSLSLSLERVTARCPAAPARIGLSATVRPVDEAARFLGGLAPSGDGIAPRPTRVIDAGQPKRLALTVSAPVPDFTHLPGESVWPEVYPQLLEQIKAHRSTLIFVRMRAQAERVSRAINELAGQEIAHPHHGSLSRSMRRQLELELKAGRLPALLSTGTLELGIDMGAIDLVIQVGSPGSVSSGLQRVGRAGHLVQGTSEGLITPLYREDLVECTVVAQRMLRAQVEPTRPAQNALDVVAQHILSAVAMDPWRGEELLQLFRRATPFRTLERESFDTVLRLLAGRYPSEVARGLAAKLTWERSTDALGALPGASQLVVMAGGMIPDNGYYRLDLTDGTHLGELEEEFVFERKTGDIIAFGSGTWRILDIDRQRVTVAPAPGRTAVIPFWKGGQFGRDAELSAAIGQFRQELYQRVEQPEQARAWLRRAAPLDQWAADNLVSYFSQQRARGIGVATDQHLIVEAFDDDLGDHRLIIHSIFGNRVNAPWGMTLRRRLRERLGIDPQVMTDDNAILIRVPAGEAPPPLDLLELVDQHNLEELLIDELAGSAMFGSLFRQNAARFLVLGLRGAGRRTPLWLQRLRAKDLQQVTAQLDDFPVRLETYRECLKEMMDLPRLAAVLTQIGAGEITVARHLVSAPSPVASGVLNRFIGQYMYEYDEPRAERTLQRLHVDRSLLDQVLGRDRASELLLPEAISELQGRWQGAVAGRQARVPEELLALVLRLALVAEEELPRRCSADPEQLLAPLLQDGRLVRFSLPHPDVNPERWICAAEDLPLMARAHQPATLSAAGPITPAPCSADEAREQLLARVLESLGPVTVDDLCRQTGLPREQVQRSVDALVSSGGVLRGSFRQHSEELTVCPRVNLKQIRRRSITIARERVAPVDLAALQRLVLVQQHLGSGTVTGPDSLMNALELISHRALPAEILERDLLPARIADYQPAWLDELIACGALSWTGAGPQRIKILLNPLHAPSRPAGAEVEAPEGEPEEGISAAGPLIMAALASRGASFTADIVDASGLPLREVQRGLWELVWAGRVTNDRFDALRRGLATSFEPPAQERGINRLTGRPSGFGRRGRATAAIARAAGPWLGRWSLIPLCPHCPIEQTARTLVDLSIRRTGLLARELMGSEQELSWSQLYPLLSQLELAGELRRGIFVEGLGAAQFAPAEIVDRLRGATRAPAAPLLLNSCDPAFIAAATGQPWPMERTLPRRAKNYVVLDEGRMVLTAESGGRMISVLPEADPEQLDRWLALLPELLRRGFRAVRIEQINGEPAARAPLRARLESIGFTPDGSALERRRFQP